MPNRLAIPVTGMAWSTALGDDLDLVWERLLAAHTGMRPLPHPARLRNSLAAAVPSVPLDRRPDQRLFEITCRTVLRAAAAARQDLAAPDVLLVLGTSLGAYLEDAACRTPLHAWADAVGEAVGVSRPPVVLSTACSSGSDAILVAGELLRAGAARCCVCGGADVLTWSKRVAHSALGTMSPTSLRAFDVRHDGTLLGEGAGILVLEAPGTDRGPLALLRGTGSANDATGMTAPDAAGLGARHAIERSLDDAELPPGAIGVINAHGSGTPLNDATERSAFGAVFTGPQRPVVFGTKGNFGHSLGATGAIGAIALLLALRTRRVPPVVGLEQPDPDFPLPLVYPGPAPCAARHGLSLTLGFGGFDTSLVFEVAP
jgi:3-oxoacyl-[acyl-carrier-protein] synthase II